ncbi:MAG: sugar-transfer associated ATP-grasp domain-containing protein, partial [Candidatus Cloacimonetes bacterium]|nr:sugar-transfer associated ATP-grasp domain-containing protein [Candidatus Cloacimonadota bacterium]
HEKIILKPSMDSGSGSGIFLFIRDGSVFKSDGTLLDASYIRSLRFDFVVQAYIEQHAYFRFLNPSSSNTIRLLVYRSFQDDSINVINALLRIGGKDSFMDHDNLGGVSIAVNQEGIVGDYAFDVKGNRYEQFNGVKISDIGPIPNYEEFSPMAKAIALKSHYGRLLGLDFTMDSTGQVMLLDINCWRNGINHFQFCHGNLFGRFTQEIIDHCNEVESFNIIRVPLI